MEYINYQTKEIMDREEALEWIKEKGKINFEFTINHDELEMQREIEEVLLEAYFWTQEAKEREYEQDGVQVLDMCV